MEKSSKTLEKKNSIMGARRPAAAAGQATPRSSGGSAGGAAPSGAGRSHLGRLSESGSIRVSLRVAYPYWGTVPIRDAYGGCCRVSAQIRFGKPPIPPHRPPAALEPPRDWAVVGRRVTEAP